MKTNIYAIYDKQAEIHGPPFTAINDVLAMRTFNTIKEDSSSDIHKYPQDYKLVKLGTFDKKTGALNAELESLAN